jgi:hypothetical protein
MTSAREATGRRMMLGLSLHGWENMMVGSLAFAAIFAVAVGISTYCVVQLQRAEIAASKDDFDRFKLESDIKISSAQARANEAELQLIEFRKPRRTALTGHVAEITEKLKPFANTKFDSGLSASSGEQADFWWDLEPALVSAGWVHDYDSIYATLAEWARYAVRPGEYGRERVRAILTETLATTKL